ncbi:PREDICTED: uncharacterized protein LOC104712481 isoform X1 [Camelina sativa]|uniref:Uncharacterized protein LOC104712481 isoform X1 n=1 Tax=Camelina sativa TaxID=90675 RepID=A0ABM0TKD9_CAMSA|nr:PREDICTED: uncharacterized protein LOC104712481 isoform X1 [Camelina sativa]
MFLRNVSLSSDERETQKLTAPEQQQITGVDGQPLIIRIDKDNTVKIGDRVIPPAKIHDGKVIPPAKIQDEEAKLSSTSDGPPVPSWGQVSPHSLIGKSIGIRMPGEYEYIRFQIEHYDVETETHYLVSAFSKKDVQDPCNWVDIRHVNIRLFHLFFKFYTCLFFSKVETPDLKLSRFRQRILNGRRNIPSYQNGKDFLNQAKLSCMKPVQLGRRSNFMRYLANSSNNFSCDA